MKSGWMIPIIVGAGITIATGLGAWNLNKTAEIPEKYATKQEVNKQYDELRTEQRYIRDAVDDIKNILINNR